MMRITPPAPIPDARAPTLLACWYSTSLITPQRISRAGQYLPNQSQNSQLTRCRLRRRKATPIRIRTIGPAKDFCRGTIPLLMAHLTAGLGAGLGRLRARDRRD